MNDLPAWITAIATVLLIAVGVFSALITLNHARKDSTRRTRPYVYAVLVPGLWGPGHWDLKIHNAGQSAARQLTIELLGWPETDDLITENLRRQFEESQILPPGVSYRVIWRSTTQKDHTAEGPLSDPVNGISGKATLILRYRGDNPKEPDYNDTYVLNPDLIEPITPVPSSGPLPKSGLTPAEKDTHRMLQEIVSALREQRRGD